MSDNFVKSLWTNWITCLYIFIHLSMSVGEWIFGRDKGGPVLEIWSDNFLSLLYLCLSVLLASWRVWETSTMIFSKSSWLIPREEAVQSIFVLKDMASLFKDFSVSNWTSKKLMSSELVILFSSHLLSWHFKFSLMLWANLACIWSSVALKALIFDTFVMEKKWIQKSKFGPQ